MDALETILRKEIRMTSLASGVRLVTMHRPYSHTHLFSMAIGCGSISDTAYTAEGNLIQVPEGTAHFLEHLLLDGDQEGLFRRFMAQGIRCNGHTHLMLTQYTMSSVDYQPQYWTTFLDHLFGVSLREQEWLKQRQIIKKEMATTSGAYQKKEIDLAISLLLGDDAHKLNIIGTAERLDEINIQTLDAFRQTYYTAPNLTLLIAGPTESERIIELFESFLFPMGNSLEPIPKNIYATTEPKICRMQDGQGRASLLQMFGDVQRKTGPQTVKDEVCLALLYETLFGAAGVLSRESMANGNLLTINGHFDFTPQLSFSTIRQFAKEPEAAGAWLKRRLQEVFQGDILEQDVEKARVRLLGRFISLFDYPDTLADKLHWLYQLGCDPITYLHLLQNVSVGEMIQYGLKHTSGPAVTIYI